MYCGEYSYLSFDVTTLIFVVVGLHAHLQLLHEGIFRVFIYRNERISLVNQLCHWGNLIKLVLNRALYTIVHPRQSTSI